MLAQEEGRPAVPAKRGPKGGGGWPSYLSTSHPSFLINPHKVHLYPHPLYRFPRPPPTTHHQDGSHVLQTQAVWVSDTPLSLSLSRARARARGFFFFAAAAAAAGRGARRVLMISRRRSIIDRIPPPPPPERENNNHDTYSNHFSRIFSRIDRSSSVVPSPSRRDSSGLTKKAQTRA